MLIAVSLTTLGRVELVFMRTYRRPSPEPGRVEDERPALLYLALTALLAIIVCYMAAHGSGVFIDALKAEISRGRAAFAEHARVLSQEDDRETSVTLTESTREEAAVHDQPAPQEEAAVYVLAELACSMKTATDYETAALLAKQREALRHQADEELAAALEEQRRELLAHAAAADEQGTPLAEQMRGHQQAAATAEPVGPKPASDHLGELFDKPRASIEASELAGRKRREDAASATTSRSKPVAVAHLTTLQLRAAVRAHGFEAEPPQDRDGLVALLLSRGITHIEPPATTVAAPRTPEPPPTAAIAAFWKKAAGPSAAPPAAVVGAFWRKVGSSEDEANGATSLDWGAKPRRRGDLWGAAKQATLDLTIRDHDCRTLANLITRGALGSLERLFLNGHAIGDAGLQALAGALASGSVPRLSRLDLDGNQVGDAGVEAFAQACASGKLSALSSLNLSKNRVGDAGATALSRALAGGCVPNLKLLDLSDNEIGTGGMQAFSSAIANQSSIVKLVVPSPHKRSPSLRKACSKVGVEVL